MPKDWKQVKDLAPIGVDAIVVVGAMEPTCEITNLLLLSLCPKEKKTIIINGIPCGPGIPEEIRKGWIGVVIDGALGPFTTGTTSILDECAGRAVFTKGYVVLTSVALESLKKSTRSLQSGFQIENFPNTYFLMRNVVLLLNEIIQS